MRGSVVMKRAIEFTGFGEENAGPVVGVIGDYFTTAATAAANLVAGCTDDE